MEDSKEPSLQYLSNISDESPHVRPVTLKMKMHIAPCFSSKIRVGVDKKLSKSILKYSDDAKGVIISYSNVKFISNLARIMYDSPFLHVIISVDFLIFDPKIGKKIAGIVQKQNSNHIGLLIYGCFNAAIPSDRISDPYSWDASERKWRSENGKILQESDEIEFEVAQVLMESDVPVLIGKI